MADPWWWTASGVFVLAVGLLLVVSMLLRRAGIISTNKPLRGGLPFGLGMIVSGIGQMTGRDGWHGVLHLVVIGMCVLALGLMLRPRPAAPISSDGAASAAE